MDTSSIGKKFSEKSVKHAVENMCRLALAIDKGFLCLPSS